MINISVLIVQVSVLVLMILPGYVLERLHLTTDKLGKGISQVILYVAQSALIITGYAFTQYDPAVLWRMLAVLLFSIAIHLIFFFIARLVYCKAPHRKKQVLIFATVFTNAGYMGIPLLKAIFSDEVAIYGSIYVLVFNVFLWSLGSYIYTGNRAYIAPKKMLFNPATFSALIGLFFFVLSAFGLNPFLMTLDEGSVPFVAVTVFQNLLKSLEALVAPLSMMVIGLRLANVRLKGIFRDKWLYLYLVVGMLITPTLIFFLTKLVGLMGIYQDSIVTGMLLLTTAAPAATATSMFAELYDGDAEYSGILVSVSSVLCVITMPVVSLLTLLPI